MGEEPETQVAPTSAIVPQSQGDKQLAVPTFFNDGDAEGEITSADAQVPRINIVGKTGALSDAFPEDRGAIVLSKETVLVKKDQPLTVIPVKIRKYYQEDTDFEDGIGKRANTAAEVAALGGQLDDRDAPNYWNSVADIDFLIQLPEGASPDVAALFYEEVDSKFYTLARYTAAKSAFTAVAKPLFQKKLMSKTVQGLAYHFRSILRSWEGNTWYGPNMRPAGRPTDAEKAYLLTLNF